MKMMKHQTIPEAELTVICGRIEAALKKNHRITMKQLSREVGISYAMTNTITGKMRNVAEDDNGLIFLVEW